MNEAALRALRGLLLDLDGVLYVEGEPIAGSQAALRALRGSGLGLRFVTNTTAHSRGETLEKLGRLGFELAPQELVTPARLARAHCEAAGHRRVALIMNDSVKEDFEGLEEADVDVDAVIIGDLGEQFGFRILNRAFRLVMDGAELVALQKNRFWMTADGLSLDAGPFVAAIEYATSRRAHVVGKPFGGFFAAVLDDLGLEAGEAAMVGDDIESDIGGALGAGLAAVLVRTGKFREDFVEASGIEPTATIDSLAALPGLLGVGEG
ncbi:MAG: TIGR01458 family HAD-type hydrolase [Solirubrobacterales bacterium]